MTIQSEINQLLKESQEINRRLGNLEFLNENNFNGLFESAVDIENKEEGFHQAVQALITHQLEKKPKEMNEKERLVWFVSTESSLKKINRLMEDVISEINQMKSEL